MEGKRLAFGFFAILIYMTQVEHDIGGCIIAKHIDNKVYKNKKSFVT